VLGLAEAGADVVITSRKLDACQEVADELAARTGRQALAHACHVGHWDEIEPLVDAAYERFGRVDILVNNAGMSPLYPSPESVTEELYDKVLAVNLKGPFRLSALLGARMSGQGRGSIVNISTQGSLRPNRDIIPYAAAKAGLNAMTLGFASALGPSVRVNCIIAGPFLTDASRAWATADFEARAAPTIPMRRIGQPDEIVGAALYFASDASSYTTGTLMRVDGGLF
jgi:NAD(P)-dependent dehydrogenase (short-subunit alcohol dehydrogenase family)